MKVNDKRIKNNPEGRFVDLPVGQAYEDKEGILCIKTNNNDRNSNCICFVDGRWEANLESDTARITPLTTTLEIER